MAGAANETSGLRADAGGRARGGNATARFQSGVLPGRALASDTNAGAAISAADDVDCVRHLDEQLHFAFGVVSDAVAAGISRNSHEPLRAARARLALAKLARGAANCGRGGGAGAGGG